MRLGDAKTAEKLAGLTEPIRSRALAETVRMAQIGLMDCDLLKEACHRKRTSVLKPESMKGAF
jgi:hypothetical protein